MLIGAFFSFSIFFNNVFTLLNSRNSWSVCRWTTYSKFFQFTNKTCFCITSRMLSEAFRCNDIFSFQLLSLFHRRKQTAFNFLFIVFIIRLFIDTKETIEFYNFAHCNKFFWCIIQNNCSCSFFQFGISHLWSDGTLPYQIIKFLLLSSSVNSLFIHISRTNSLVSFLSTFTLCFETTKLHILFAHYICNSIFAARNCKIRKIHRVGTHIGNLSSLVKFLRNRHSLSHSESEFASCLLLQCWSCKRCSRTLFERTHAYIFYCKGCILTSFKESLSFFFCFQSSAQLRFHLYKLTILIRNHKDCSNTISSFNFESLNFAFTFHNKTYSYRLYTSRRQCRFNFFPKNRG